MPAESLMLESAPPQGQGMAPQEWPNLMGFRGVHEAAIRAPYIEMPRAPRAPISEEPMSARSSERQSNFMPETLKPLSAIDRLVMDIRQFKQGFDATCDEAHRQHRKGCITTRELLTIQCDALARFEEHVGEAAMQFVAVEG